MPALIRRSAVAYLFMAPAMVVLGWFWVWPIVQTLRLSLYNYNVLSPAEYVGLSNYRRAINDPVLLQAAGNTLRYTAVAVPVLVVLPLLLACAVFRARPAIGVLRTLIFAPFVTSTVVVALMFKHFLQSDGLVNSLALWSGVVDKPIPFLTDPHIALYSVMMVAVFKQTAFFMVIYLAGLAGIPAEVGEAASIDGAGAITRFRYITVPLLLPTMALVAILTFINSMQVFDEVYLITQGGPGYSTLTMMFYVYHLAFEQLDFGYAMAVSVFLLTTIALASLVMLRLFERRAVVYT